MAIMMIATIRNNQMLVGVRLLDTESKNTMDVSVDNVKKVLLSGTGKIENLVVEKGELKGLNGSIERYDVTKDSSPITIINNIDDVGYEVSDAKGQIKKLKKEELVQFIKQNKCHLSNGKLRDDVVSSISGTYSKVEISEKNTKTISQARRIEIQKHGNNANLDRVGRMKQLVDLLNKATYAYEQEDREIMSNYEYDKAYDELVEIERVLGYALRQSPTQKVGYEVVSKLPKEKHTIAMLSLNKTKDIAEMQEFVKTKDGILSWKLDGLTIVLTYNEGKLIKGVTRGNGEVGEVVTNNVKQFKNVPLTIPFKEKLVLRGEAVIAYSDFKAINNMLLEDEEKYKNPRNLCSGSVRQLNSEITSKRNVRFFAFDIIEIEKYEINTKKDQLHFLEKCGFNTIENVLVNENNIADEILSMSKRIDKIDLPSDGLVLTYNDVAYGESLGMTSKFPRHSIAFKWKDELAETRLKEIEWSASRTGLINPIAIFEPVDLEGSTVARASVHNISILESLKLGVGDRIRVYKANMIIPQIYDNLDKSGTIQPIEHCPVCHNKTTIKIDSKSNVKTLYCTNDYCMAKGIRLLTHFVGRDAFNIDGLSEATLQKLHDEGIIEDYTDLFSIQNHGNTIMNMPGFGEKSYINMINSINKSRTIRLCNLIYALGISNVGLSTAKLIADKCDYKIINLFQINYNRLIEIDGIGEVIADSVIDWLNNEDNVKKLVLLTKQINIVHEEKSKDTSMQGLTLCYTGSVEIFKNRNQVKEIIESKGGKLTGSVTSNTNYLITNDTNSGSSKNKKASELGVEIITEQQFIDKFNILV